MDPYGMLELIDERQRAEAFESNFGKLEAASILDLALLRLCIRLLPPFGPSPGSAALSEATISSQHLTSYTRLWSYVLLRIPENQDLEYLYALIKTCSVDESFLRILVDEVIRCELEGLIPEVSRHQDEQKTIKRYEQLSRKECVRKAAADLSFIECSFWLPKDYCHAFSSSSLEFLSRFVGIPELDHIAHDALSALLSFMKSGEPQVVVDQSFWDRLSVLEPSYFASKASKAFRTWFQWISQAVIDGVKLSCLSDELYWDRVRTGLMNGHGDQRKYCIGIIHQSLLAAHADVSTSTIRFRISERQSYLKAYAQFSTLFETIVLDRYANQVQACLPELTTLFGTGTKISAGMATALLSAALNPNVQEGIRKLVGNWYIDYVVYDQGNLRNYLSFLTEGFLPWATEGALFTSSLTPTRATTKCSHGARLASAIATLVLDTQNMPLTEVQMTAGASDTAAANLRRCEVVLGVLNFILDARGKIFQTSILYLLEGLIIGLKAWSDNLQLRLSLTPVELHNIIRISRLPGLPEISRDLLSIYCKQLCDLAAPDWASSSLSGTETLCARLLELQNLDSTHTSAKWSNGKATHLQAFMEQLRTTNSRYIQGNAYIPASKAIAKILDDLDPATVDIDLLYDGLCAFWDEADRREFVRPVAVSLPTLLFHPTCIHRCMIHLNNGGPQQGRSLDKLLISAIECLQQLSDGRVYLLAVLAKSIRRAIFSCPSIVDVLPIENFILHFLNQPPSVKTEFLFEVAAAERLQSFLPHRTYSSYYGQREWHAYAAMIDLLQRIPPAQLEFAKRVLDKLLEPWQAQQPPILIISKWKNTLQLQAMLVLAEYCILESDVDVYLDAFMHALVLEHWPRYRFLLEWIIARIHYRFPGRSSRILRDLKALEDSSPIHIASLMKIAVLVTPFQKTGDFAVKFATQLIPFSASPKVHIRHEAQFSFPIIFDLALAKGWAGITENPAFEALNMFIRQLNRFNAPAWTIRTLALDAVSDFTIVKIFQGEYLSIESPEKEKVAYEDFLELQEEDRISCIKAPPERITLGAKPTTQFVVPTPTAEPETLPATEQSPSSAPAFLQTKSGFDLDSLHPSSGPPSKQNQRPASVILVASLIDNPTNLGGLSRISESFGLEGLYINDIKKIGHKDFKATSVTSEKHFPIGELKVPGVPDFLLEAKRKGYEVIGIEQTDRSGILGDEGDDVENDNVESKGSKKDLGTLPKKCVLVLGSEKGGISPEVLAVIDRCVEIKTAGVTRSLNVQTAGGIALYEWWREWGR